MIREIHCEFAKLRRSSMLVVAFAGAAITPLVTFVSCLIYRKTEPAAHFTAEYLLNESGLYLAILIGPALFGVLATWVFNREFAERTMKELVSVPVSRANILCSKMAVLLCLVLALCAWTSLLCVGLGYLGGFAPLSPFKYLGYLGRYLWEGFLMFALLSPIVFATLLLRNYVPVIVITVGLTLVSILVANSQYRALFPWAAILPLITGKYPGENPLYLPWVSVLATSALGWGGSYAVLCCMEIS